MLHITFKGSLHYCDIIFSDSLISALASAQQIQHWSGSDPVHLLCLEASGLDTNHSTSRIYTRRFGLLLSVISVPSILVTQIYLLSGDYQTVLFSLFFFCKTYGMLKTSFGTILDCFQSYQNKKKNSLS